MSVLRPIVNQREDTNMSEKAKSAVSRFSVATWLEGLNLTQYYDTFVEEGYDQFDAVCDLTEDELTNTLQVKKGHIKVLLKNLPQPDAKPKPPRKVSDSPRKKRNGASIPTTTSIRPIISKDDPTAPPVTHPNGTTQYAKPPVMIPQQIPTQMVRAPMYALHRPPTTQQQPAKPAMVLEVGPKKRGRKKRSDTPVAIQSTYIHPAENAPASSAHTQPGPRYIQYPPPPNGGPARIVEGQRRAVLEQPQATVRMYMQQNGVPIPQYQYHMAVENKRTAPSAEKDSTPPGSRKRGRRPRTTTIDLKPINHGQLAPAPPQGARVITLAPGQIAGQPYGPILSNYQQYPQPRQVFPPKPPLPASAGGTAASTGGATKHRKVAVPKVGRPGQSAPAAQAPATVVQAKLPSVPTQVPTPQQPPLPLSPPLPSPLKRMAEVTRTQLSNEGVRQVHTESNGVDVHIPTGSEDSARSPTHNRTHTHTQPHATATTIPSNEPHTGETSDYHQAAIAAKLTEDTDLATAQAVMALTNGPDSLAVSTGMHMDL